MAELAIGTVQFGLDYGIRGQTKVPLSEIVAMLITAADHDTTVLDTAAAYGDSELVLGQAMAQCGRQFAVVSKISKGEPSQVREQLAESLRRLKIDALYGCLFHDFNLLRKSLEYYRALEACRQDGMTKKIGVSLYYPEEWNYLRANGITPELVQIPYNLLDRRFEQVLPQMRQAGTEVHVRSVFLQGLFGMKPEQLSDYFSPVKPALSRLNNLSTAAETTPLELAFRFVSGNPAVNHLVIGMISTAELRKNLQLIGLPPLDINLQAQLAELESHDEKMILPFNWPK